MTSLRIERLGVEFRTPAGAVRAVESFDMSLAARETVGIVGESGSGKTQVALALLGLVAGNATVSGRAWLGDTEFLQAAKTNQQPVRGRRIAMVFQDPMTSLNPYLNIGRQLQLVLKRHRQITGKTAEREILGMLDAVRLPNARRRLSAYPHEFSGGMRQRIMIAAALLSRPEVLIADEATTALDVTVQASILALLAELRDAYGMALVLISHDLGVIAGHSDRMLVMHRGRVVEEGPTADVFSQPQADHTRELLGSALSLSDAGRTPLKGSVEPLLVVDQLQVSYDLPRRRLIGKRESFHAVDGVSLRVTRGETLGLVGESGCGKSSLARAIVGLVAASGGRVSVLRGNESNTVSAECDVQMVFQDPLVSLNPRMHIRDIVAEPLTVHRRDLSRAARYALVDTALQQVGLSKAEGERFPHELSGGQCQRAGIARALVIEPALLVCDEALSALDASVQAGIVELLLRLQKQLGLAILFIAHDLAVVKRVSHRIAVMYLGRIVELGSATTICTQPLHPYTQALLASAPVADPKKARKQRAKKQADEVPAPWSPPSGCSYRTRCPHAVEICSQETPKFDPVSATQVACLRLGQLPHWQPDQGADDDRNASRS